MAKRVDRLPAYRNVVWCGHFCSMGEKMHRALWVALFFVAGVALLSTPLKADTLAPGGSGAPDSFVLGYSNCPPPTGGANCGPPRTVVSSTLPAGTSWGTAPFSGSAYEQVEKDPSNPFCAGCLDFLFQLSLNSNSNQNLTRVTETGFAGYMVDAGWDTVSLGSLVLCGIDDGGFCNSGALSTVPVSVDRSADGNTIGFNFSGLPPGQSTVDIVIMTNATSFTGPIATIYGSNGATGTIDIYGPSGPPVGTPEPSTALLIATALFALPGLRKKLGA